MSEVKRLELLKKLVCKKLIEILNEVRNENNTKRIRKIEKVLTRLNCGGSTQDCELDKN